MGAEFVVCVWLWSVLDSVVGGLVCGGWIGAEMCVNRSLVSVESKPDMAGVCISLCINSK